MGEKTVGADGAPPVYPRRWNVGGGHGRLWLGLGVLIVAVLALAAPVIRDEQGFNLLPPLLLPLFLSGVILGYFELIYARRRGYTYFRPARTGDEPAECNLLAYARGPRIAFYAVQASSVVFLAAAPTLADAIPSDGSPRSNWFHTLAPYMPIVAIYFGSYLLSPLVRKRLRLGIGMSRTGVYHCSWFGCCFFRWEWITGVRAVGRRWGVGKHQIELIVTEPSRRPENGEENWVAGFDFYRKKLATIPAGFLDVNPAAAYYALHYYLRHPEKRDELGTDAAVDRMCRLDFPDIIAEIKRYGDVRTS